MKTLVGNRGKADLVENGNRPPVEDIGFSMYGKVVEPGMGGRLLSQVGGLDGRK